MNSKKLLDFRISGFNYSILGICLTGNILFLFAGQLIMASIIASVTIVLFLIYSFSKGRAATEFDRLSEFQPGDEREVLILRKSSAVAIKFSVLTGVVYALALTGFFTGSLDLFGLGEELTFGLLLGGFLSHWAILGVYTVSAALFSSASNRD
jgi:hypothetical protein